MVHSCRQLAWICEMKYHNYYISYSTGLTICPQAYDPWAYISASVITIAYIHTCINTYIRTCIHTHIYTCIYTYIHTCQYAYIHTYYICTYIRTYIHTYKHTCLHTYMHTYIHTNKFICIYTYTFISCIHPVAYFKYVSLF